MQCSAKYEFYLAFDTLFCRSLPWAIRIGIRSCLSSIFHALYQISITFPITCYIYVSICLYSCPFCFSFPLLCLWPSLWLNKIGSVSVSQISSQFNNFHLIILFQIWIFLWKLKSKLTNTTSIIHLIWQMT